ncbi:response regulator transcription factor [Paenibacillus eucommiae]|uniref:Two-component system response regulator YesN n=1 Tax=Paenibacillus eucommiae TaxID=1355755 RepID=A0ABS4IV95_9BACL|nr:response regulator transcription factor [Paenibacillus eucommiae]MBP1991503.1 two-component system response regulator YesN [Paenibacillus eucommiae]
MYKVLIVDDEMLILKGLQYVINWEEHGAEIVASAKDGIEAMEIVEQTMIHIMITDIKMPNMDGLELIRTIRRKGLNIKIVILSSYDDFEFVKEASKLGIENYLLKPVEEEELSDTILHSIKKIDQELQLDIQNRQNYNIVKENILNRWVTHSIRNDELVDRAGFLQIKLNYNMYMACIISRLSHSKLSIHDVKQDHSSFSTLNICQEILGPSGNPILFNSLSGDLIIIFAWNHGQIDEDQIHMLLELCIQKINQFLKMDVCIALGSIEKGYQLLHKSYQHAYTLKDYRLLPPNSVTNYEQLKKNMVKFNDDFTIDYESLKSFIISNNKTEAFLCIDSIFERLKHRADVTPEYVLGLTMEILIHIFGTLQFPGTHVDEIHRRTGHALFDILRTHQKTDLSEWLKLFIGNYMDHLEMTYENIHPTIKTILAYIDDHYAQEMSLKTLSDTFNVNAAYLGQLFKKTTGDMFSNYLNRIRVEKSKELLAQTTLKSNQISTMIGFTNVTYFSNIFKKHVGVYPIEYRKALSRVTKPTSQTQH